jgi:hypothetical protein
MRSIDFATRAGARHELRTRRAHTPNPKTMYSGQLRELHRLRGSHIDDTVHKLVEAGIAPIGGGATGQGAAAFFLNMPPAGTFTMDPAYFNQETERNDVPQQSFAYTGLGGGRMDNRITNTGILTVSGSGTVTPTYQFPENLIKSATVNANGQTSLIQAQGMDLRARRQRLYRNPVENIQSVGGIGTGAIANGSYSIALIYDLPIVHDMTTLTGALFAQSDSNYLSYSLLPAAVADLFTVTSGSAVTLTGTFYPLLTYFDIPYADTQQGRVVAIPDLRWLHGFLATDMPFANTGNVATPLIKNAGQLLALYTYLDNGGAATISWLAAVDSFTLNYGGNRSPLTWSGPPATGPVFGLEENQRNYNGLINPYLILDLENDNPQRDLIYPRGVSELQTVAKITAGTTINANAHVHFVEETLFSGQ